MRIKPILFLIALFLALPSAAQQNLQQQILEAKNRVLPALVHVQPIKEVFSAGKRVKVQVTGSGVIFSPEGYVLTNNHVAEKARQVICTLANKDEVPAEVIGLDALTDLAVLKLDLSQKDYKTVPFVELGNSNGLEVGQIVLALGSPLGLSRSVSMGVISSLDRYFEDRGEMVSPFNLWIQTDAAINPGNSGGPLVNIDGEVIGINARSIFFGENLGFAIPINTAKLVIEQILSKGRVDRSWLGVEWQEINEYRNYVRQPGLNGALLAHVEKNSPAEKAGLLPGDLITSIDGQKISAVYKEELPRIRKFIAEIPVGKTIRVEYLRSGKKYTLEVQTAKRGKFEGNEFECSEWGLSVKEITPRIARALKLEDRNGVLISGVRSGSRADESKLYRGQVIRKIDGKPVENL